MEVFQSRFKMLQSTESALLESLKDILLANDTGDNVCLVLLDPTAAFGIVEHSVGLFAVPGGH